MLSGTRETRAPAGALDTVMNRTGSNFNIAGRFIPAKLPAAFIILLAVNFQRQRAGYRYDIARVVTFALLLGFIPAKLLAAFIILLAVNFQRQRAGYRYDIARVVTLTSLVGFIPAKLPAALMPPLPPLEGIK